MAHMALWHIKATKPAVRQFFSHIRMILAGIDVVEPEGESEEEAAADSEASGTEPSQTDDDDEADDGGDTSSNIGSESGDDAPMDSALSDNGDDSEGGSDADAAASDESTDASGGSGALVSRPGMQPMRMKLLTRGDSSLTTIYFCLQSRVRTMSAARVTRVQGAVAGQLSQVGFENSQYSFKSSAG